MMINTISTPCEPKNGVQGAQAQTGEMAQPENCFLSVLDQMLGNPTAVAGSGRQEKTCGIAADFSAVQSQSETEEDSAKTKPDETQNITAALPFLFAEFGQIANTDNPGIPTALNTDSKPAKPIESTDIAAVNDSVPLVKTDNQRSLAQFLAPAPNGTAVSSEAQPEPANVLTDTGKVSQGAVAQEISREAIQQEIVMTDGNQNALFQAEIVGGRETFDAVLSKTNGMTERTAGLDNDDLSKESKEGGPTCFSNITTDHATKFKMSQDDSTAQNNYTNLGKGADQTTDEVLQDATSAGGHSNSCHIEQMDRTVNDQAQKPSDFSLSGKAETEEAAVCKKEEPNGIQEEALGLITVKGRESSQMVTEAAQKTNETEAFSQVTEQVAQALSDKDSANFKMKLHPAGLGEILVTLTCRDDKVALAIVTQNPATQKLLVSQADQLKAALLAKNYEVTGLNVSASAGSQSHTASNDSFSFENGYSGFDANSGFAFSERSWGNEENDRNREYSEYSFADHALGGEEEMVYRNQQGYYTGRLNFWA